MATAVHVGSGQGLWCFYLEGEAWQKNGITFLNSTRQQN